MINSNFLFSPSLKSSAFCLSRCFPVLPALEKQDASGLITCCHCKKQVGVRMHYSCFLFSLPSLSQVHIDQCFRKVAVTGTTSGCHWHYFWFSSLSFPWEQQRHLQRNCKMGDWGWDPVPAAACHPNLFFHQWLELGLHSRSLITAQWYYNVHQPGKGLFTL